MDSTSNGEESMNDSKDGDKLEWSHLPGIAMEKIYSFLNTRDQCQMSLVCRNWSAEYHAPSLWQKRRMIFSLIQNQTLSQTRILTLTERHGCLFRHVEIHFNGLNPIDSEAQEKLKYFLELLTRHGKLLTITFRSLSYIFHHFLGVLNADKLSFAVIKNFLAAQVNLRKLSFYGGEFDLTEAFELLRAVCVKNCPYLKCLAIRDFVDSRACTLPSGSSVDLNVLQTFINFDTLSTDYTGIFADIIAGLMNQADEVLPSSSSEKGKLGRILLQCRNTQNHAYRGISPEAWRNLKQMCPLVRIDMIIVAIVCTARDLIERFVTVNMPVRSLEFREERNYFAYADVQTVLRYLAQCGVSNILEELTFVWPRTSITLNSGLTSLLSVFTNLTALRLCARHPVRGLYEILATWIHSKPKSLRIINVRILNILSQMDAAYYRQTVQTFYSALKTVDLELTITTGAECPNGRFDH